jgi:peroxiredoxin
MAQLGPLAAEFEEAGARLALIAAEKREGIFKPAQFLARHPVPYPFLLDEDRRVTKAYGVYHRLGKDAFNIARPATFVAGRDGTIRFLYVGTNQHDRAPVEQVLQAVRAAAQR